ncbi:hypothetical protein SCUP234_01859 [Seiridium cupressi]
MLLFQVLSLCASAALAIPTALPPFPTTPGPRTNSSSTVPACSAANSQCAFTIRDIAYQKYDPFPGTIDEGLDSMTMAFDVANNGNGINTACSFTNGKYLGQWTDNGTKWFACGNRTVTAGDGEKFVVQTNARFNWDTWNLAVNQTWVCGNGYGQESDISANVSVLLTPACSDTSTTGYAFRECSAPDTTAETFPFS